MFGKSYSNYAIINYFLLIIIISFFLGCEKDEIVSTQLKDYTPDFDSVWTTFDQKYPLFEYKKINWNEISQQYRDQFISISLEERNNLLIEIFSIFRDAHIYFVSPDKELFGQYIPSYFTTNFNTHYLTNFINSINWNEESPFWGWAKVDNAGYIKLIGLHEDGVDTNAFDNALDSLKTTDGIIIDIRELHGGNLIVCESLWNRFTNQNILVGNQLYRNGPGHNDYAPLIPMVTNPHGDRQYLKKIILLIGQLTFSGGEIFAETLSQFTHVILIGDTTFGGVEAPFSYKLSGGTEYSVPIVAYLNAEEEPLEWKGVQPDIYFDPAEVSSDSEKDIILEKAFELIKQK